jgi:hypothetical protein
MTNTPKLMGSSTPQWVWPAIFYATASSIPTARIRKYFYGVYVAFFAMAVSLAYLPGPTPMRVENGRNVGGDWRWFPFAYIFLGLVAYCFFRYFVEIYRYNRGDPRSADDYVKDEPWTTEAALRHEEQRILAELDEVAAEIEAEIAKVKAEVAAAAPPSRPAAGPEPVRNVTPKLIIPHYIGAGKRVRRGGDTLGGTKINDRRGRDPRDIL